MRLLGFDPRFRLHPTLMMWSYMRLEKLRIFQNNTRIFRQRHVDSTHTRPSAIQWLRQSRLPDDRR